MGSFYIQTDYSFKLFNKIKQLEEHEYYAHKNKVDLHNIITI